MSEQTGNMAREMAAAPLPKAESKPSENAAPRSKNPLVAALLPFLTLEHGDGRQYERTTGFGRNKTKHPDGGTNETAAFLIFRPYKGLDLRFEGRVYLERWQKDGMNHRTYSISLPFLKVERKDAAGRDVLDEFKVTLRQHFQKWQKAEGAKAPAGQKANRRQSEAVWSEDEPINAAE